MNQATLEVSEKSYPEQSFPWPSSSGSSRFPYNSNADNALDVSSSSGTDSEDDTLPAYRYHPDILSEVSPSSSRAALPSPRPPLPLPLLLNQPHHRRMNHSMVDLDERDSPNSPVSHQILGSAHRRSSSATMERSPFHDMNHIKRFSRYISPPMSPLRVEHQMDEQRLEDNVKDFYESETVGQEPGVDVQTMNVELPDCVGSQITIIDYSPEDCKIAHYDVEKDGNGIITGSNEQHMVQKNLTDALNGRPEWCKVRWIVVNGLSWEAIKPITVHYKLHPLAVEDMLDIPQRTKMEVFEEQLFCCYPLHVLNTTKTPYSIAHLCIRQFLLGVFWAFDKVRWCFSALEAAVISLSQYFKDNVWNPSSNDVENNPRFGGVSAFSEEDAFGRNTRPNIGVSSPVSVRSISSSTVSGTSFDTGGSCYKRGFGNYNTSVNSRESICNSSLKEDKCVPFYTINHGILYGDASSSFVAEKLRQMPPRSIYDWNQGNYVLKKEALQNMHIPNTPYSYEITLEQVSLFMVGDTVITFFEKSGPEIYMPLENRLMSHDTMLRQSSDPAILVQAILDASVDLLGPILNAYRTRLSRLQVQSIQQPNLQHTRALHAFMTDLSILRPPISSIASLVNGLWSKCSISRKHTRVRERKERRQRQPEATSRHFRNRSLDAEPKRPHKHSGKNPPKGSPAAAASENGLNKSVISEIASLYFGDVTDHALRYLQDLDDMKNQSMTLSSLIFNTISIHGSDYMKMLSLVSVIFLPLTFLTGYFGMNFKTFAMLNNDVAYYWIVAAPAAAALSAIVMYSSTKYQLLEIWSRGKAQL